MHFGTKHLHFNFIDLVADCFFNVLQVSLVGVLQLIELQNAEAGVFVTLYDDRAFIRKGNIPSDVSYLRDFFGRLTAEVKGLFNPFYSQVCKLKSGKGCLLYTSFEVMKICKLRNAFLIFIAKSISLFPNV